MRQKGLTKKALDRLNNFEKNKANQDDEFRRYQKAIDKKHSKEGKHTEQIKAAKGILSDIKAHKKEIRYIRTESHQTNLRREGFKFETSKQSLIAKQVHGDLKQFSLKAKKQQYDALKGHQNALLVRGRNDHQTLSMARRRQTAVLRDLSYEMNTHVLSKVKPVKGEAGESA